jgi:hypothetical protein
METRYSAACFFRALRNDVILFTYDDEDANAMLCEAEMPGNPCEEYSAEEQEQRFLILPSDVEFEIVRAENGNNPKSQRDPKIL